MSWTSNGFFRNINILSRLTAATGDTPIDLYRPGTLNPASIAPDVTYSGFVRSLRLAADIKSINEVVFPTPTDDQSDGEINAAIREVEVNAPKKQLNLLLRQGAAEPILIGSLWLYNRRPYYSIDLLTYFTDAEAHGMASDTTIVVQVQSVGYGLLEDEDSIVFHGFVEEEGENIAPNLIINVTGSTTIDPGDDGDTGGGTPVGATTVTTTTGEVVTTTTGEVVTNA